MFVSSSVNFKYEKKRLPRFSKKGGFERVMTYFFVLILEKNKKHPVVIRLPDIRLFLYSSSGNSSCASSGTSTGSPMP